MSSAFNGIHAHNTSFSLELLNKKFKTDTLLGIGNENHARKINHYTNYNISDFKGKLM